MNVLRRRARDVSRSFRRLLASSGFSHANAQRYELAHAQMHIAKHLPGLMKNYERERANGGLWLGEHDQWFEGDGVFFSEFVDHVRTRTCLEIGSGPFGHLAFCYWIKERHIIDPLIDAYRDEQIRLLGKSLFEQVTTHATPAETVIDALVGKINGAIVCRNALDHCDDPLTVICNAGKYATPDCYLLLWTDIWHKAGLDDGHHNITKTDQAIDGLLRGLGFEIVKRSAPIRDPNEYVEYGVVARKTISIRQSV